MSWSWIKNHQAMPADVDLIMERFGEKLRALREQEKMSQRALSQALKVDQRHVSRMERGERAPSAAMILKIADVFEVCIDRLMRDGLELK